MPSKKRLFKYFWGIFFVSFCIFFNSAYATSWTQIVTSYTNVYVNPVNDYLYSVTYGSFLSVKKFDGSSWDFVGAESFADCICDKQQFDLTFHPVTGDPYIAYRDTSTGDARATVKKFDGSSWVNVGSAKFSRGAVNSLKISFNPTTNEPYVIFNNYDLDTSYLVKYDAIVMKFDGSSWVTIGDEDDFSDDVRFPGINFDLITGDPYVVYSDMNISRKAIVKKFDGTSWNIVGSLGISEAAADYTKIVFNPETNEPYVAYIDINNFNRPTVKKFDGVSWGTVGQDGFDGYSGVMDYSFDFDFKFRPLSNEIYLTFLGNAGGADSFFLKFNGLSWKNTEDGDFLVSSNFDSFAFSSSTGKMYLGLSYHPSVGAGIIEFPLVAETPVPSIASGTYTGIQSVTLTSKTQGADIYYTTDGTTPTQSSNLYSGPVSVSSSLILKAIAVKSGIPNSDILVEYYSILDSKAVKTKAYHPAGTYREGQLITLTTNTPGASIYYTTDGTTPTQSSNLYSGPVSVSSSLILKAIAVKSGMADSDVMTEIYTISNWIILGDEFFSTGSANYVDIAFNPSTNEPYVSYSDYSTPTYGLTVKKFNGASWETVGTEGFSATRMDNSKIKFNPVTNEPYVLGGYGTMRLVKFDGSSWVTVGSTISQTSYYSLAFNPVTNEPYAAFADHSSGRNGKLTVKKFDGSSWVDIGSPGFSTSIVLNRITLKFNEIDGFLYAAYSNGNYTTVSKFDGTSWTDVWSSPLNVYGRIYFDINQTTGEMYIFLDSYYLFKFDGSSWVEQLQPDYLSSINNLSINQVTGEVYVLYQSTQLNGRASLKKFNGVSWADVDTPSFSTNGIRDFAPAFHPTTNDVYVVYGDYDSPNKVSVKYLSIPTVATPTPSVISGTFNSATSVILTTETSGSSIYYTTDGTTPTQSSTEYVSAISISTTTILKALAIREGYTNSPIMSEVYVLKVATPTASVSGGTFSSSQNVTLTSTTTGATIYYTIDGTTPTTSSNQYSTTINITSTTTLKAIAVKTGFIDSDLMNETYNINLPQAEAPTTATTTGTYNNDLSITLTSVTSGATIYYTTDGSTPTTSSNEYSTAISISTSTTLKAIAIKDGYIDSNVMTETYTFQVATPTLSISGGTFTSNQSVTITSSTVGATIYYTTDGTTPTISSNLYTTAINIATTTTLKAIAIRSGYSNSSISSETYTIKVNVPIASPLGLSSSSTISVTLTSTTTGATIYYTTDGSTPTASSNEYSTAISITSSTTLKAIAIKSGLSDSNIMTETYTIFSKVATPTASPVGSSSSSTISVTLTSTTTSATIYYTTDGSIPTTSSTQYSVPISISSSAVLKAIAVKDGYTNSDVMEESYTIFGQVIAPTASPGGSNSSSTISVVLSSGTSDSAIYYTIDGSTPTQSSTQYTGSILVSSTTATTTIKAIAIKDGHTNSNIMSEEYFVYPKVATPTASTAGGFYTTTKTTTLSVETAGATIYYTTDGTTPTRSSTQYSSETINISTTTQLKAIAVLDNYTNSELLTENYSINLSGTSTILSNNYTISNTSNSSGTITNIPYSISKAIFMSALRKGQDDQTWNVSLVSDPVVTGNTIVVTAQDGINQRTYTLNVLTISSNQATTSSNGVATINATTTQVVITDTTKQFNVSVSTSTSNPTINLGSLIVNGTGTLPSIIISSSNADNVVVVIATSTVVTSASTTWNGVINAPATTTVTLPTESGQTKTLSTAIEVGVVGEVVVFSKAVRILLPNQAGKRVGYIATSTFTEITSTCSSDSQTTGDALSDGGECKIDSGSDLVIWTKHFTTFATYTQTATPVVSSGGGGASYFSYGGGGGGWGYSYSAPAVTTSNVTTSNIVAVLPLTKITNTNQISSSNTSVSNQINTNQILSVGSLGKDVEALQKFLYNEGYLTATPNGYFGKGTEKAVKIFQSKYADELLIPNGFKNPTGMVGESTRSKINELLNITNTNKNIQQEVASSKTVNTTDILSFGSKGDDVLSLQKSLYSLGYLTATPNGYFGKATEKAVKSLQNKYANELLTPNGFSKPTGMVGEATRGKIDELISSNTLTKITNTNQISSSNTSVSNQINTNQILSVGSLGKDVEALQKFLYNEGYLTATPNGYFGKGTEKAVKIFQSKYADELLIPNGFKNPTGMVGESTRSKINELIGLER